MLCYPILGNDISHSSGGSLQRWTGVVTPAAPGISGSHSWSKTTQVPRCPFSWAMKSCREHRGRLKRERLHPTVPSAAKRILTHGSWQGTLAVGGHPLPRRLSAVGPYWQQLWGCRCQYVWFSECQMSMSDVLFRVSTNITPIAASGHAMARKQSAVL